MSFGPELCGGCSAAYSVLNTRKSCPRCHKDGCVRCVKFSLPGSALRVCADCSSSSSSPAPASTSPDKPSIFDGLAAKKPPSIFDDLSSPPLGGQSSSPKSGAARRQPSGAGLPALKSDSDSDDDDDDSKSSTDEEENPFSFFRSAKQPARSAVPSLPSPEPTRRAVSAPTAVKSAGQRPPVSLGRSGQLPSVVPIPHSNDDDDDDEDEEEEDDDDDDDGALTVPSAGGLASLPSVGNVAARRDSGADESSALVALAAKVTQLQTALDASNEKARRMEELYSREKRSTDKLQQELLDLKKKEADDTKAMETMLQAVEKNLVSSQQRAVLAEKQLRELEAKHQAFAQQHQQCSGRPADSEAAQRLESLQQVSSHVSDRLLSLHADFATAMSMLLSRAKDFKELAEIVDSMGRTAEQSST